MPGRNAAYGGEADFLLHYLNELTLLNPQLAGVLIHCDLVFCRALVKALAKQGIPILLYGSSAYAD